MDSREKPVTIQKYKSLLFSEKGGTMKLEYLYLDGYKSLKKVSLSLKNKNISASVNFLIGQNGSGKSSLLEAIGLIFSRIMQEEVPGFEFKIRYRMPDGTIIQVMSDIQEKMDGKLRVEIKKQGETIQTNKIPNEYLPDKNGFLLLWSQPFHGRNSLKIQ